MVLTDDLPTDSVLHRHALTERNRRLGLPPTDAVLRRHYDQLQAALLQGGRAVDTATRNSQAPASAPARAAAVAAAPAAQRTAPPRSAATHVTPTTTAPAAPAPRGGLFGWLRRLLGA
ncbi:hypothetical protein [Sphaerotilus microaerophilus]|jgi:hypothetical protein|uniref:J domain-containing protein n=1 Tax=Sphaerotilus microaerophilus TaxID=2914710 RepID=A0ABN6PJB5_9BURK|nr:hypothetical protein [Sphaerotilus sp. FB-5]BDI03806.1 hypothetical protein CATMQ487_07760 [Sphaerotilus sp. FB-5]